MAIAMCLSFFAIFVIAVRKLFSQISGTARSVSFFLHQDKSNQHHNANYAHDNAGLKRCGGKGGKEQAQAVQAAQDSDRHICFAEQIVF